MSEEATIVYEFEDYRIITMSLRNQWVKTNMAAAFSGQITQFIKAYMGQ